MPTPIDRFTRDDVLRIVGVTPSQLGYWERLELVRPQKVWRNKVYTFQDIVSLKTVKQLKEQRVPPGHLRQALDALRQELSEVGAPLAELRIRPSGTRVAVEYQGIAIEPISGQFLLNFGAGEEEAPEPARKVSSMPDRSLEEWLRLAIECEKSPELQGQAIEAYEHVIELAPDSIEARINLGTLLYERGDLAGAAGHYQRVVRARPENPLAQFNLGTALEDLGSLDGAYRHLNEAVRLRPGYADAHYNLARVCDKLNLHAEAREHWQRYLELEPNSPWAKYARQRLGREPVSPHQH